MKKKEKTQSKRLTDEELSRLFEKSEMELLGLPVDEVKKLMERAKQDPTLDFMKEIGKLVYRKYGIKEERTLH